MSRPSRALPPPLAEAAAVTADDGAARVALQLRLRGRGIDDLDVLRALDIIGRAHFVAEDQAHLAWRDMALPAANGGNVPEPGLLGQMAMAAALTRADRVLELGTASGYATAILAQLAGEVVSIDRFPETVAEARQRLNRLGIANATLRVADLKNLPADLGRFSRILVHGCLAGYPNALLRCLTPDGVLVLGRVDPERPARRFVARARAGADGRWSEDAICACRLPLLLAG